MAYVFVLNDDNCPTASHKETIMQRSKLVDDIWILVNPNYKFNDMSLFSVMMEYVLPVSKKYHTIELVKDEEGYKEYLKYVVPLDTNLSSEAGDVEFQLTFAFAGLDPEGEGVQKVRKTKTAKLHITPIAAWSDIIPDDALNSLDQRIIKIDAQIKHLGEVSDVLNKTKADNIKYDEDKNSLRLTANGNEIGDKVTLKDRTYDEDGVPVVDLDSTGDDGDEPNGDNDNDCENDVVEF